MILRAKNITARQFAEEIGIQPSGMSHILGGRNNPSLDFAVKVLKRYPEIDANWLLLGKGAMYGESLTPQPPLLGGEGEISMRSENGERQGEMDFGTADRIEEEESGEWKEECEAAAPEQLNTEHSPLNTERDNVERLLLIYSDNTYEVLTPRG